MRAVFSAFLLGISIFFLVYGLKYEYLTSSGQVGAGFFPFWLGTLLVITTGIAFIKDFKNYLKEKTKITITDNVKTFIYILVLSILFIIFIKIIGAILSMVLYMFAVLLILNRRRLIFNSVLSLSLAAGCYLLLDVWLNAGLPKGILGF